MEKLPYNQIESVDYRYIKQVRFLRNKTLKQFAEYMNVDYSVISRIENNQLEFTPIYQERFKKACKRLRVSGVELVSIRQLLESKTKKGYK